MKKAWAVLSLLLTVLLATAFTGCDLVYTITENGTYNNVPIGNTIVVDVPQEVGVTTNNVIFGEVEANTASSLVDVIESVRPAVVDVYGYASNASPSAGSGVIIGKDEGTNNYYVITNHHVIADRSTFSVSVLSLGEEESMLSYDAVLIGSSPYRDIAVLRITANVGDHFTIVPFVSDSSKIKAGTEVFAIGNPLGILGGTVTRGIVSATAREVVVDGIGKMKLMQTDAAINNGNSGGGLFNTDGVLVGVVNSGYSDYEGLNFAIPSNDAKAIASNLLETYAEDEHGNVTQYGYVDGDFYIDADCDEANVYADSSCKIKTQCVYLVADTTYSVFYGEWGTTYKAIYHVKIVRDGQTLKDEDVTTAKGLQDVLDSVEAHDQIVMTYKDVMYKGFGFNQVNYIDATQKTATFTAQYVYVPPTDK